MAPSRSRPRQRSGSRSRPRQSRSRSRSRPRSQSEVKIRLRPRKRRLDVSTSTVKIPIKKGGLAKYMTQEQQRKGYTNLSAAERHRILTLAMNKETPLVVFRRLNAMVIMRKNKSEPKIVSVREKFLADRNWVHKFL